MTNPTEFIKLSDMMMGGSSGVVIIGFFMWMKIKENKADIKEIKKTMAKDISQIKTDVAFIKGKLEE